LKILEDNQFRRPVYFAVTVSPDNKLNLDSYMRMDGLAFKVLPVKVSNRRVVDPEIMWTNLNEKFQYRNLNNPKVYYDDNTKSLLGNYRSAFLTLAQYHLTHYEKYKGMQVLNPETRAVEWQNSQERALQVLDRMNEVIPESVIPTDNFQFSMAIGQMYEQLGRPEELDKRLKMILSDKTYDLTPSMKIQFADFIETYRHQPAVAESLVQSLVQADPNFSEGTLWLSNFYARQGQYARGVEVLERWLTRKPEDQQAKAQLQQLKTLAQADSLAKASRSGSAPPDTASEK
jgi:predicted Zn-dependent protease